MSLAAAVEKVAGEIAKLPQAKEGEAVQAVSKSKLNELHESIRREREKREDQARTIAIEGYGNSRRQSVEKTAHTNQFGKPEQNSHIADILQKKAL